MAKSPRKRRRKGKRRSRPRARRALRLVRRWTLLGLPVVLAALAATYFWIDRSVVQLFDARTRSFPSRVYAAPFSMRRGHAMDPDRLETHLKRLGYVGVAAEPRRPGQYLRQGNDWVLYLRDAPTPDGPRDAMLVKVDAWWGKVRRIRDLRTTAPLDEVSLEPLPLFAFYGDILEERQWVSLDRIPPLLLDAVEAVEDRRFRDHHGVDLHGIARAFVANVRAGGTVQGGSTITQQLVKNLIGPGRRTLGRKGVEALGAIALELRHDKDAILEAYLNEVYLGQRGPVAISGIGDASRFYFGRAAEDLDLPRCALLAGMIQSPGRYNPWRNPDQARARRDVVLKKLREQGDIDDGVYRSAVAASLGVHGKQPAARRLPWIEEYLAQEVRRIAPEAIPSSAGFSVFTSFDPAVQRAAQAALQDGLDRLEARLGKRSGDPLEGAIVVLRPDDGALLALVGGRDYSRSQFFRAVNSRRPPGSTFKPFVFAAALERSASQPAFGFTAATLLEDTPLSVRSGGQIWSPANYDRTFREQVTARQALEESINVPTVRVAMDVGLPAVVETAHRCGVQSELDPLPALALGTEEVTPLELASSYATFANGGYRVTPHGLEGIVDVDGSPIFRADSPRVRALDPALAYLVTNLLEGVMTRGTGRSSSLLGFSGHAAGKTGSSDDLRDAWFVGYTPGLLALVWVGYDDNRPVGLPGAAAALPIWVDLMGRLGIQGQQEFEPPRGIVEAKLDTATGQLATRQCTEVSREIFLAGTEPVIECEVHAGKRRRGFWRRLFD